MTAAFDHRETGTSEQLWAAAGLDRLPRLEPPLADACVLVVAAHPDDETLGAGGLMSDAAARGARIRVLVATDGEASHPRSPTHSPEQLAQLRRTEVVEAVAAVAHSAQVEFLGLPDGGLAACHEPLVAAIVRRLDSCTHVLSPWQGDRHPDHEACALAVRAAAAAASGAAHWQYPIWAWHWATADGTDLPWSAMGRLELTDAAVRAKGTALGCHVSQHSPLSDVAGDEAILPPHVLTHFHRAFETFVVEPAAAAEPAVAAEPAAAAELAAPASEQAYFDALYDASDDPWGLGERFYEHRKRDLVLASLPRPRFARAFEPGCATGRLTAELLSRCDEVLAWDGSASAVRQSRERVSGGCASIEQRRIPDEWPDGTFDLIVLSEVAYYCADLGTLVRQVHASLAPGGVVVGCHWRHPAADHPHSAQQVHDVLDADLRLIARHREDDFLLDVWSITGESVARTDGILPVIRTVGVIVPAVNEQATIRACLDSLDAARKRLRGATSREVNVRIVVVLDSCVDETAAIVQRHRDVEPIVCSAGRAGAARAAGVRWLLTTSGLPPNQVWLANTDADSTVPCDWIAAQVEEADRGAHLVLGTVLPELGLPASIERSWFDSHRLREGHPHVHGANLGVRADVYTALGGWPDLATGEDVALVARATSAGHLRIIRTARIPVRTSSRLTGRAPNGFAAYLRGLSAAPEELAV